MEKQLPIFPGDIISSYDYDCHGNLESVIDAENHETVYIYDDQGRVVTNTSPDTGTTTYLYDASGNLVQKTDAKNITVNEEDSAGIPYVDWIDAMVRNQGGHSRTWRNAMGECRVRGLL